MKVGRAKFIYILSHKVVEVIYLEEIKIRNLEKFEATIFSGPPLNIDCPR